VSSPPVQSVKCAVTGVPASVCTCIRCQNTTPDGDEFGADYEPESDYCECGSVHSEGTEELDSGICSSCGGIIG
jgi:hypothetical protein